MLPPSFLSISPLGLLALGAAACAAFSGIVVAEVVGRVGGSFALARLQMLVASAGLALVATALRGWGTLALSHLVPLALSSVFAIVLASPAYNTSITLLGARRATLLFSLNAPLGTMLAWLVLGERLGGGALLGGGCVLVGILLAVAFGYPGRPGVGGGVHVETVASRRGIAAGLLAAAGQAVGNLAARPALADHLDPVVAMWVRVTIAAIILIALSALRRRKLRPSAGMPPRAAFAGVVLGTLIGLVLGMSLLMAAIGATGVGVASTLAATSPIMVLPMLWLRTGRAAPWPAWCGAAVTATGTGLIFLG